MKGEICIEEGCNEESRCYNCHRCQKHHDEQPDVERYSTK